MLVGLTAGPNVTARAEGTASTFVVTASLGLDGTLKVRQDITFAGQAPAEVKQTLESKKDLLGDRRYVYELSGFQATAGGQPVTPTLQTDRIASPSSPSRRTGRPRSASSTRWSVP